MRQAIVIAVALFAGSMGPSMGQTIDAAKTPAERPATRLETGLRPPVINRSGSTPAPRPAPYVPHVVPPFSKVTEQTTNTSEFDRVQGVQPPRSASAIANSSTEERKSQRPPAGDGLTVTVVPSRADAALIIRGKSATKRPLSGKSPNCASPSATPTRRNSR